MRKIHQTLFLTRGGVWGLESGEASAATALGKGHRPHVNSKYCSSTLQCCTDQSTEMGSRAVKAGQQGHQKRLGRFCQDIKGSTMKQKVENGE